MDSPIVHGYQTPFPSCSHYLFHFAWHFSMEYKFERVWCEYVRWELHWSVKYLSKIIGSLGDILRFCQFFNKITSTGMEIRPDSFCFSWYSVGETTASGSTIGASLCCVAFDMSSKHLADVVEIVLLKLNVKLMSKSKEDRPLMLNVMSYVLIGS